MLVAEEARQIARDWRPQFEDEASFETSWRRFFEMVGEPTAERLVAWLAKDQARDQALQAGVVHELAVPQPSAYEQTRCAHCGGRGYVRVEVPMGDARFGRALRCPDCNGGRRSEVVSVAPEPPVRSGNWCWRCGATQDEPAAMGCRNPGWHLATGIPSGRRATLETVLKRMA